MKNKLKFLLFPLYLIFVEIVFKTVLFQFSIGVNSIAIAMATLAMGFFISFLNCIVNKKVCLFINVIFMLIFAFFAILQLVYFNTFQNFFFWQTIGIAGDLMDFLPGIITAIKGNVITILILLLPIIIYIILYKKFYSEDNKTTSRIVYLVEDNKSINRFIYLIGSVCCAVVLVIFLVVKNDSRKLLMNMNRDSTNAYQNFGVAICNIADIYQNIFGSFDGSTFDNRVVIDKETRNKIDVRIEEEKMIPKNILDIDFQRAYEQENNSTIKSMHQYFANKKATNKNDYTGYFAGKNLILINAESFYGGIVDKKCMPILYQMINGGFVFNNYYCSQWGGSTATGEYTTLTGQIYNNASALGISADTYQPFALGNLFKTNGYDSRAYHDHQGRYYNRYLSHPNFGFKFKSIFFGLNMTLEEFPESDQRMAEVTVNEYANSTKPFCVEYMTVSAHGDKQSDNYVLANHPQAQKHIDKISSRYDNCSETIRTYVAANMELEYMMEVIFDRLDETGQLNNTVFVLTADHYPYLMSDSSLSELYGLEKKNIRSNFDLYKNSLIIYCPSMETPIVVDTPVANYDILPTIANLFGLEYDSRLYMGTDVFSDNEHICIISTMTTQAGNDNWKTEKGTYYCISKTFIPNPNNPLRDEELEDYINQINSAVTNMKNYSYLVLDKNYYSFLFNLDGSLKYPYIN